jgi:chromosome segregation ATPase
MEEYIDNLKEFYEKKSKMKKTKGKIRVIEEIEKIPYYYNKEYLRNLEDSILEEKNNMLRLKYNILYGLAENESDLEKYDEIEETIKELKEERDRIKIKIDNKEDRKKKEIKKINDDIHELMFSYKEVPEDRKEIYNEIQSKREKINDILNNDRTIILKEINKIKIYSVFTDYQPILGNEINLNKKVKVIDSESNGSNSGSNGSNGSNGSIEYESLDATN